MPRRRPQIPFPTFLALLSTCVSLSPMEPPPPPPPPPPPFHDFTDPAAASAAIGVLESALGDTALRSFLVVAPILSISGGRIQFPSAPTGTSSCAAVRPLATTTFIPTSSAGAILPDSVAQHVFVYNDGMRLYDRSSDSSGPSGGVRFLLYGVDTLVQRPTMPLSVVGWMDLIDLTTPGGTDSLRGIIAANGTPLVDYLLAPIGSQPSWRQILTGSVTSGGQVLAFRDSTTRLGARLTVTATLDDSSAGTRLALTVVRTILDQFDYGYSLDFSFIHGADTVRLKGTNDAYCTLTSIGILVTVNGGGFATVTNGQSASMPTITRTDSLPLSPAQETAVRDLIRGQAELFNLMAALSWPGALLLPP